MSCAYFPQLCSLPGICSGDQEMAANILVALPFWILGIKMELGSLQREEQETRGSEKHLLDLRKTFHRRVVLSWDRLWRGFQKDRVRPWSPAQSRSLG